MADTSKPIAEPIEIHVNLAGITYGDAEKIMSGEFNSLKEQLDLLDRIVVGGIRNKPLSLNSQIMAAVQAALSGDDTTGKA